MRQRLHENTNCIGRLCVGALVLASLVAGSCKQAAPQQEPPRPGPPPEAVALLAKARKDVAAEQSGQLQREPLLTERLPLFVPPELSGPSPLLVFLHGLGGSGQGLVKHLQLQAWAALRGFVLLAPEGATNSSGRQYWNATGSCCDFEGKGLDHIGQLRSWIGEALEQPLVDAKRVYLIGYSNGGYLAHRAACELGPTLRGIFSIAGAAPGKGEVCERLSPLSVVQIHGTEDPIVAYGGGFLFADKRRPVHPSAEQSLAGWAQFNGCTGELVPGRHLNLDERLPGPETQVYAYQGCEQQPVQLWKINGGDHSSGLSRRSVDAIWSFIDARN